MSDLADEGDEDSNRSQLIYSRPTLEQIKALVALLEKNPAFANKKQALGSDLLKYKKFWFELAQSINSIEGATKSSKGWLKFWSDKKRKIVTKVRDIKEGRIKSPLTPLEVKIYDLCETKAPKKRKMVKQEACNGDDSFDVDDDLFMKSAPESAHLDRLAAEAEERQFTMLEKMIGVMDQQSSAMTQMAQTSLVNSKAMESIAEASHVQALAVDRLVDSFISIGESAHDIRNAILGIDYTLKRCYPNSVRQDSTLFS